MRLRVLAAGLLVAASLHAQTPLTMTRPAEPGLGGPVLGGAGLGAVGWLAGALIGARVNRGDRCYDECGLEGAIVSGAIGGTIGMAMGVHLGNRSRGSAGVDFLVGAGVWGAGIALASASRGAGDAQGLILVAIPVAQMITMVAIERSEGRRKDRVASVAPTIGLLPLKHGMRLSLGMPLPWMR